MNGSPTIHFCLCEWENFCWLHFLLRFTWHQREQRGSCCIKNLCWFSVRSRSLSCLSPPFPGGEKLGCSVGLGIVIPQKVYSDSLPNLAFFSGLQWSSIYKLARQCARKASHALLRRCPSVLPEDVPELRRAVEQVGQVLGNCGEPLQVKSVRTGLDFTLVELCTVCLPLCVNISYVCTRGGTYTVMLFLISQNLSLKQWQ